MNEQHGPSIALGSFVLAGTLFWLALTAVALVFLLCCCGGCWVLVLA